ncbi:hypothetical protein BH23CHL2_BH23CHL2_28120 [soil metagenome]
MGSFGDACWLPGQARLIVSEDRGGGQNPNAGSMFTIRPDGSDRELLISAGQFGPAVNIGQILSSPDGSQLAFTVETPNQNGEFQFRSLYVQDIASGVRRQIDVATGQEVSDLWWFEGGLAWRAVSIGQGPEYDGVEPFLIEVANLETGQTRLVYSSDAT